uniref:FAM178 domain-containing protein n=1 Tax=Haemonchus contortus TaxID=6289 RepID=A0A7I4YFA9_HAECO
MRNSKTNLMHDAVRRTAVAPIPKKFYRKSTATTYTDSALSENESDEYPKIRSYIKPNKNINTYNRGLREQRIIDKMCGFQKLNRSLSFNHQRSASHKPISGRSMSNEKKRFSPVVTECAKAPPTLPSQSTVLLRLTANVPGVNGKKQSSSTRVSDVKPSSSHHLQENRSSNFSGSDNLKRRNIPRPPPLPQKRPRISSPPSTASVSQATTHSLLPRDPDVLQRKCSVSTSSNCSEKKAIIEEIVQTSEQQFKIKIEQSHRRTVPQSSEKCSQRKDCSLTKGADGSTTGARWNEHMNLALFHSLRIKIFNSSTLPEEGKWDLDELSQVTTSKTKTLRKSARDSIGFDSSSFVPHKERQPSGCFASRVETPSANHHGHEVDCSNQEGNEKGKLDNRTRSFVPLPHEPTSNGDCGSSQQAFPLSSLNSVQKHLSTLRSCFTQSGESSKKNVTFSEDLVTTIFYEATNQELTQVSVGDTEQSTDNEKVGESLRETGPSSQKSLPLLTLEQIKREVEEDEVQILFSGKRKYIEALCRERREDQHSSKF